MLSLLSFVVRPSVIDHIKRHPLHVFFIEQKTPNCNLGLRLWKEHPRNKKKMSPYQIIIFSRPIVQIVVSLQIDAMESVDLKRKAIKYLKKLFFSFCKIDCGNCKIVETNNRPKFVLGKLRSIKKSEANNRYWFVRKELTCSRSFVRWWSEIEFASGFHIRVSLGDPAPTTPSWRKINWMVKTIKALVVLLSKNFLINIKQSSFLTL